MEHHSNPGMVTLDHSERIAILETKTEAIEKNLVSINAKLDELLHLKSKGMGAIWLVGILLGSGLLGIVATVMAVLNGGRSHL